MATAKQINTSFELTFAYFTGWRINKTDTGSTWVNEALGIERRTLYDLSDSCYHMGTSLALHRDMETLINDANALGVTKVEVRRRNDVWVVKVGNGEFHASDVDPSMVVAMKRALIIYMIGRDKIREGLLALTEGELSIIDFTETPNRNLNHVQCYVPQKRQPCDVQREWEAAVPGLYITIGTGSYKGNNVWYVTAKLPQDFLMLIASHYKESIYA